MDLLNEYRERSYFRMPGECNVFFQSLIRQITIYCDRSGKGNGYRVLGMFIVQFLLNKHIITYGENRDLTVYYDKETVTDAINADKAFIRALGPVPRNTPNVNEFKKRVPEIDLPSEEYDLGSSIGLSRPDPRAKRHITLINKFIQQLIQVGRFNCSHVEELKNYAQLYLRGYTTQFQRKGLEGTELVDAGGYQIAGKQVELEDFVYDPNFRVTYTTAKSLLKQAPTQAATQEDVILNSPDIVYLFFFLYYIPTFIRKKVGNTDLMQQYILNTDSIEEFEERVRDFYDNLNDRIAEATEDENFRQVERLEELLADTEDTLSLVEDFKSHTREYMFGMTGSNKQLAKLIDDDDDEDLVFNTVHTKVSTPSTISSTASSAPTKRFAQLIDDDDE